MSSAGQSAIPFFSFQVGRKALHDQEQRDILDALQQVDDAHELNDEEHHTRNLSDLSGYARLAGTI
eukprot:7254414-Prymnesium_polylepis.1